MNNVDLDPFRSITFLSCVNQVLRDHSVSKDILRQRARGLKTLGKTFQVSILLQASSSSNEKPLTRMLYVM